MPFSKSGIYYEISGPSEGIPLLLIEGYQMQLIGWHPEFCEALQRLGFRLILVDNRDVGLSKKYGGPDDIDGGYSIDDMADDAISVLEAAEIDSAHIVGQSMGGMIAQRVAVRYPERTRSLGLIYTTADVEKYRRGVPAPIELPERRSREDAITAAVERERVSVSPGFAFDEEWALELATRSHDRCYAPDGFARQLTALRTTFVGDQSTNLSAVKVPVTILHGRDDPYFHGDSALALAEACENSNVHLYAGMGHEIPRDLYDDFAFLLAAGAKSSTFERN